MPDELADERPDGIPGEPGDAEHSPGVLPSSEHRAWLVRLPSSGLPPAPRRCACCGAEPTRSMRETRPIAEALLVPYCASCHRHASAEATKVLTLSVTTALLAVTLTAGLPLVFSWPSLPLYAVLVGLGALAPSFALQFSPVSRLAGHAAHGRAARFRVDGVLECRSAAFAEALGAVTGLPTEEVMASRGLLAPWAVGVVVLCGLLLVPLHRFHFPVVRVVNASGDTVTLTIDGVDRGRVPSTSRESELAGVELRVPAGKRLFQAFDVQKRQVDSTWVIVEGGAVHLYAPASSGACFRVETTAFGRAGPAGTSTYPLVGPPYFWVLPSGPEGIDYWFSPAPPPSTDTRSSGGLVRALRQAACAAGL